MMKKLSEFMELAEESGTTSYQSHLASKAPQFWKKKRELPNLGLRDKAKSLIQKLRSKKEKSSKSSEDYYTKPTQKALPSGKSQKSSPAGKDRSVKKVNVRVVGGEKKKITGTPERKKLTPQKKSIAGGSSSIVKRTSSDITKG